MHPLTAITPSPMLKCTVGLFVITAKCNTKIGVEYYTELLTDG